MKRILFASAIALAFTACNNETKAPAQAEEAVKTETVQEVKTTPEATNDPVIVEVANFATKAEGLNQKPVVIKGIVDHVCKRSGRKLMLVTEGSEDRVMVYADKDMPNFSTDWEGTELTVNGMVVDQDHLKKLAMDTNDHHAGDAHNHEGHDHSAEAHNHDAHSHNQDAAHNHEGHNHDADAQCDSEKAAIEAQKENPRMFYILASSTESVAVAEEQAQEKIKAEENTVE
ncbi:MAG: hypothetical protein ACEPOW_13425 [Bacteroidales bacterium]